MTPEEAFLLAIRENPGDAIRWQMYADWLEERGDGRAVFYREWRSTSSLGMTFVTVPRGTYWMGGGGGKPGKKAVSVEEFQIGIYPVTQGQWRSVTGRTPSWFSRKGKGKNAVADIPDAELDQFPVEHVSWDDAQKFIKKLNAREKAGGWVYRLPREAEWEYACRAGATSKEACAFHFYLSEPTNALSSSQANFDGTRPDGKAPRGPNLARTTKVGSYPPNRLGVSDMHGNVWEWCEDTWGGATERVARSGGWNDPGKFCRASFRVCYSPSARLSALGLRLARSPAGK